MAANNLVFIMLLLVPKIRFSAVYNT